MLSARKTRISAADRREFPAHPRVGVGGIVIDRGRVLLIRRGQEPLKREWSIPGGLVEVGEKLAEAVEREIREETGLRVEPLHVLGVFERVVRTETSPASRARVQYHYVVVDFLCRLRRKAGKGCRRDDPRPSSDVTEACWAREGDLDGFGLSAAAHDLICEAFSLAARRSDASPTNQARGRPNQRGTRRQYSW